MGSPLYSGHKHPRCRVPLSRWAIGPCLLEIKTPGQTHPKDETLFLVLFILAFNPAQIPRAIIAKMSTQVLFFRRGEGLWGRTFEDVGHALPEVLLDGSLGRLQGVCREGGRGTGGGEGGPATTPDAESLRETSRL